MKAQILSCLFLLESSMFQIQIISSFHMETMTPCASFVSFEILHGTRCWGECRIQSIFNSSFFQKCVKQNEQVFVHFFWVFEKTLPFSRYIYFFFELFSAISLYQFRKMVVWWIKVPKQLEVPKILLQLLEFFLKKKCKAQRTCTNRFANLLQW